MARGVRHQGSLSSQKQANWVGIAPPTTRATVESTSTPHDIDDTDAASAATIARIKALTVQIIFVTYLEKGCRVDARTLPHQAGSSLPAMEPCA